MVPVLALLSALALVVTDANERVFLLLNHLGAARSDVLWADITILGDTVVALSLCLAFARRRPELLWAVVVAGLLATAWVHVCKPMLDVARPPHILSPGSFHVIGPVHHYHSFPSGHATTAFALAGLCVLGLELRAWIVLPVAIAAAIAFSRVVVGVHWPLDVLAGAAGGWLAAAVGLKLAARLPFGLHPVAQWAAALAFAGCAVALVLGFDTGYPQALWFQRAIGLICLAAFGATFVHPRAGASGW